MTDRDIDRIDAQRDLPVWGVRVMTVAWPSFVVACVLEMVVFAFVDPQELHWGGHALALSRQGVYSVAFFVFWALTAVASTLSLLMDKTQRRESAAND